MKRNGSSLKPRSGFVAVLDIGTTKICCLIAKPNVERGPYGAPGPRVVGIGTHQSHGIRNGVIVDMDAAEHAIRAAVERAEQMAGDNIDRVVINISAGKPQSRLVACEVSIGGHGINEQDMRRLMDPAVLLKDMPDDREIIHKLPVGFSVDGNRGVRDPIGMFGQVLGVNVHVVTAASAPLRNLQAVVERCHLDVDAMVVSPFASALACLVEDEKKMGAACIDIGGGTTGIALFFDGELVHTDIIPVGGNHITNDIARGLSTPFGHAERMKNLYGTCLPSASDDGEVIQVPLVGEDDETGTIQVPRSMLVGIIRPRVEEILDLARERLEKAGFAQLAGRVVLTGGTSQLTGISEMASQTFAHHVRTASPRPVEGLAEAVAGPAFSGASGLLQY
ncbi:MAG: cell division protein FtsA, partial [Rhodospirillales bacterium]|nr:cell division protein FtsA [Rhodospirillales bacterium]